MENQEQHNKLIAGLITVFVLMIIVTTVTAIMFLTEKNKLVKQNRIANDIIRKYNNTGDDKKNVRSPEISKDDMNVNKQTKSENEVLGGEEEVPTVFNLEDTTNMYDDNMDEDLIIEEEVPGEEL